MNKIQSIVAGLDRAFVRASRSAALLMLLAAPVAMAQTDDADVQRLDRMSRFDYRPGQVIVKFKDNVSVAAPGTASVRSLGVSAVDQALAALGVESIDALMPLTGADPVRRSMPGINGKAVAATAMDKAYLLTLASPAADVMEATRTLAGMAEVEYAEPNYLVHALADNKAEEPDDPYYSQQWGLQAINMIPLWGEPCIAKEGPVVAIIDTGVDIWHPDLTKNIWKNPRENAGVKGYDDDGNGYKDDLNGWDFVNNSGNIYDYNGHGTHCAGIVGATGHNGLGIVGACPFAQIMPVTAMQSDGTGDVATIVKAIDYATANGAQIISMSLGTYAESAAMEQALARAYQKAVIVAAAGNDGYCLNHAHPERGQCAPAPMFPAAYTFVLGVQAAAKSGGLTGWTNYDDNGPLYSGYSEDKLYNYEITAPGANIISTYPNGNYRSLNGTSMATPLVAGAIARYMMSCEVDSKEELFGDIINTANEGMLDIYAAYKITGTDRQPTLQLVTVRVDDSQGDGDGNIDAGETIAFYPTIRNGWGKARNIRYSIRVAEEANTICEILNGEADFGMTLSSYGKAEATTPVVVKMNPDLADGRHCRFLVTATCDNVAEPIEQEIMLVAENGVEIGGVISEDMTLTAGKNYIVNRNIVIAGNTTLTIEPGVTINFKGSAGLKTTPVSSETTSISGKYNNRSYHITNYLRTGDGKIIAHGTPDKPIIFNGSNEKNSPCIGLDFGYESELDFCIFNGFYMNTNHIILTEAKYCSNIEEKIHQFIDNDNENGSIESININIGGHGYANNCLINNCDKLCQIKAGGYISYSVPLTNEAARNINITDNYFGPFDVFLENLTLNSYNLTNNKFTKDGGFQLKYHMIDNSSNIYDNYKGDIKFSFDFSGHDGVSYTPKQSSYLGTGRKDIAQSRVFDINQNYGMAQYNLSTLRTRPYSLAHAIVWKVVVDGYDAQDEYMMLPPLGVGKHKVEVYFNREMDRTVPPTISMGVRPPYTQTAIGEDGSWRSETYDGETVDIYTAYLNITGRQNIDGINRIYVADARDKEYFQIPVEDMRFNVNVETAGSLSTGFFGESGVGCVHLEWEDMDMNFDDIMGYNLYRYTAEGDTVLVNERLIEPEVTSYTDYDVKTGTTYLYFYKVMTTALTENDPSKVVAVTPLTAAMGDANGSGDVDVNDILTTVNYIGGADPRPFIFEAADINADADINILDVVGIAHAILDGPAAASLAMPETAYYWVEDGSLWLRNTSEISGLQLTLAADRSKGPILPGAALARLETMGQWRGDDEYVFLAFSLSGASLEPGLHEVLKLGAEAGGDDIEGIVLGDSRAQVVPAERLEPSSWLGEVAVDEAAPANASGIYNPMGIKIADSADAFDTLPAGIYIVNGTKVVKK